MVLVCSLDSFTKRKIQTIIKCKYLNLCSFTGFVSERVSCDFRVALQSITFLSSAQLHTKQSSSPEPIWSWLHVTYNLHPSLHSVIGVLCRATSCRLLHWWMCCWLMWVGGWTAVCCPVLQRWCFVRQLPQVVNLLDVLLLTKETSTYTLSITSSESK